jgi:hypothetical protein
VLLRGALRRPLRRRAAMKSLQARERQAAGTRVAIAYGADPVIAAVMHCHYPVVSRRARNGHRTARRGIAQARESNSPFSQWRWCRARSWRCCAGSATGEGWPPGRVAIGGAGFGFWHAVAPALRGWADPAGPGNRWRAAGRSAMAACGRRRQLLLGISSRRSRQLA